MKNLTMRNASFAAALLCLSISAHAGGIKSEEKSEVMADFDIVETTVAIQGDMAVFTSRTRGSAGATKPAATGKFEGSEVHAYVWPTSLNSSDVGFDKDQGIVALAATFHPDFSDGAKGAKNNEVWHAHWVVLGKDDACKGGLKVVDIPKDAKPKVPETWPGVPLLIDSPDYATELSGQTAVVRVPVSAVAAVKDAKFDGVTAGLRVNANLHAPLLCVENVFKITSGDLSLPGTVDAGN
jgi:hypothetical protein